VLLFLPALPSSLLLAGGGVAAFILTYLLTFAVSALCRKFGWVEPVTPGKIHTHPLARIGGVAIFLAFLFVSLTLYAPFLTTNHPQMEHIFGHTYPKELVIYGLFIVASLLIVAVHMYDDIKGLKPLPKLLAQTCAVLILLGPGLHTFQGVLFFGVNNPFVSGNAVYNPALPWYQQPELTLFIREPIISWLAIPAVLFTWFWFVGMMNAINFIDGLDGLAAGIAAIVGLFIAIISWRLGQYSIAVLAAIFAGATAGFLPHNWHPSKIIMGDSGSQFIGLALAVLAIMGGAKFALILMILGIPILDIALVAINRIRRGQHPMQRDILPLYARQTHIQYRLLFGGLNPQQICYLLYGITAVLGLLAISMPRLYKFIGFALVGIIMVAMLWWSTRLQDKKASNQQETIGSQK
jgi:UDP-GlcNAc:undecaprenyl-phosphate GlcNAc-1-phosphate transferase